MLLTLRTKGEIHMRFFIITKKHLMLGIVAVLAVIGITVGSVKTFANTDRKLPIYCVETDKKQVAISFDAAWGNAKKVQNPSKAHNYWVCASSVFHKNPDFSVILQ